MMLEPKADLWYGASGSWKTTNIGRVAKWLHATTGRKSRLVAGDGGGFGGLSPLINRGILDVWCVIGWPNIIATIDKASQGYWPVDVNDPTKGLKPYAGEEVGLWGFEGLTSLGDLMMRQFQANRTRLSQDPSYIYTDGDQTYGGTNMAYFGEVQNKLHDFVMKSHMLKCIKPVWTALEARGEEDGSKVYGPAIVGKKSIGKATQWFCNSIHLEIVTIEKGVDPATKQLLLESKSVAFTRTHADAATKVPFPCKVRAPFGRESEVPQVFDPPKLDELYIKLAELDRLATEDIAKEQAAKSAPASVPVVAPSVTEAAKAALTEVLVASVPVVQSTKQTGGQ